MWKSQRKHSQASYSKVLKNAIKNGKAAINELKTGLILPLKNGFKEFTILSLPHFGEHVAQIRWIIKFKKKQVNIKINNH